MTPASIPSNEACRRVEALGASVLAMGTEAKLSNPDHLPGNLRVVWLFVAWLFNGWS